MPADEVLTNEERIAESTFFRRRLIKELPPTQFRVLQLFFQKFQFSQLPLAIEVFRPMMTVIIKKANLLVNNCNPEFAVLCCLSTAWNINLFSASDYGPVDRYYYPMAASRKKRRLDNTLEVIRKKSIERAESILMGESKSEQKTA